MVFPFAALCFAFLKPSCPLPLFRSENNSYQYMSSVKHRHPPLPRPTPTLLTPDPTNRQTGKIHTCTRGRDQPSAAHTDQSWLSIHTLLFPLGILRCNQTIIKHARRHYPAMGMDADSSPDILRLCFLSPFSTKTTFDRREVTPVPSLSIFRCLKLELGSLESETLARRSKPQMNGRVIFSAACRFMGTEADAGRPTQPQPKLY